MDKSSLPTDLLWILSFSQWWVRVKVDAFLGSGPLHSVGHLLRIPDPRFRIDADGVSRPSLAHSVEILRLDHLSVTNAIRWPSGEIANRSTPRAEARFRPPSHHKHRIASSPGEPADTEHSAENLINASEAGLTPSPGERQFAERETAPLLRHLNSACQLRGPSESWRQGGRPLPTKSFLLVWPPSQAH